MGCPIGETCLGRLCDERFSSQMDNFILVVRLAAQAHQGRFPPGQAMLFNKGVMDMPAIHAAVPGRPYVPAVKRIAISPEGGRPGGSNPEGGEAGRTA